MFLHIMVNQLCGWPVILHMLVASMLFYSVYYDIIHLISLKVIQAFHLLLDFAENQTDFWDLK